MVCVHKKILKKYKTNDHTQPLSKNSGAVPWKPTFRSNGGHACIRRHATNLFYDIMSYQIPSHDSHPISFFPISSVFMDWWQKLHVIDLENILLPAIPLQLHCKNKHAMQQLVFSNIKVVFLEKKSHRWTKHWWNFDGTSFHDCSPTIQTSQ